MTLAAALPDVLSHVTLALRGVNTRDLLTTTADVLIVYYVVFRILKLVRGTRAAQTLAGMALLGGLFFLAKLLDLFAVSWLFEKLIDYFIIFFVVIFQQDLRRALMQVGQNLFMRRQYEETYVIEEVVQAAGELAKKNIGGLIVIERDADLSEHLGEVGIELDARVTKELLVTVFIPDPQNHMHDGAVIIRNLRVQQAGAVLPLSGNVKLDKQFGTRHRAAIGITEETDAVVVAISEERGEVSLCFNGNIVTSLDAATLRKALLGLFQKKKAKGKGPQAPQRPPAPTPRAAAPPVGEKPGNTDSRKVPAELLALLGAQTGRPAAADGRGAATAGPVTAGKPGTAPAASDSEITVPRGSTQAVLVQAAQASHSLRDGLGAPKSPVDMAAPAAPHLPVSDGRPDGIVINVDSGPMTDQSTAKFIIPVVEAPISGVAPAAAAVGTPTAGASGEGAGRRPEPPSGSSN